MPRYIAPVDLWDATTLAQIESGCLRLQRGQWIKLGPDNPNLSRLHAIQMRGNRISYIRAFHYPRACAAFLSYCRPEPR